ncbi:MAG: hypothetical protein HY275_10630 [Gemmatimonadetes bacterium]|nr:hypothetical protein [Gemmatimonadota bacterium]
MRIRTLVLTALLAALPAAARAQSIDPGFSRAQVEARLGKPAAERTVGDFSYLFYNNGCEIACGQHDIVVLKDGKVSDAIFRGTKRSYTGQSSSPSGRTPKHKRTARKKPEPRPV